MLLSGEERSLFERWDIFSTGRNLLYRYISFFPEINFARERKKNSTFKFLRRRVRFVPSFFSHPFFLFHFCLFLPLFFLPFFLFLLLSTYSKRKIYSLIPLICFIGSRPTEEKKRFISLFRAIIHFSKKFTVTHGELREKEIVSDAGQRRRAFSIISRHGV